MFIVVGMKNSYGIDSTGNSSAPINDVNKENNNNRCWPVDHCNRYKIKSRHHQTRNTRRYKFHRYQEQFYCKQCSGGSRATTTGNTAVDRCNSNFSPSCEVSFNGG